MVLSDLIIPGYTDKLQFVSYNLSSCYIKMFLLSVLMLHAYLLHS
uniref:Uncharacterized protein n=1 Tax=Arundo donax TaxID=35708 RepID=A0A0A9AWZ4_ARUDO